MQTSFFYLLPIAIIIPIIYHLTKQKVQQFTIMLTLYIYMFYLIGTQNVPFESISITILAFLWFSAFFFQLKGSLIAIVITFGTSILFKESTIFDENSGLFLVFACIFGIASSLFKKKQREQKQIQQRMFIQSKELSVFHEISLAAQSTFDFEKLLHIYLSAITAGYGLSFNRAMLFFNDLENNTVNGVLAIGPLDAKEGFKTYQTIIDTEKHTLQDLIYENGNFQNSDENLNKIVKQTIFSLDGNHVLNTISHSGKPIIINEKNKKDTVIDFMNKYFSMTHFAIIPLLSRGKQIGLLFVDNVVNERPITQEGVDTLFLIATLMTTNIEQSKQFSKTEVWAMKDGLTNLNNQRAFSLVAKESILYTINAKQPLSLCILDIDYFKVYNDTNGHIEGNYLLKELARLLEQQIRHTDSIYRFGGEEFIILMPNTTECHAKQVAQRLRENIERYPFAHREKQPSKTVTVSIGVAQYQSKWTTYEEFLAVADEALYHSKNAGRNTVTAYGELR